MLRERLRNGNHGEAPHNWQTSPSDRHHRSLFVVHSKNERLDLFELIGDIAVKFHDSLFDLQLCSSNPLAEVEFVGIDPDDIGRESAFEVVLSVREVHPPFGSRSARCSASLDLPNQTVQSVSHHAHDIRNAFARIGRLG